MSDQSPQEVWREYFDRISARRLEEARALWQSMSAAGVDDKTVLALDFVHFSSIEDDAKALAKQLSENYSVKVVPADQTGYWRIESTTRPHGVVLREEQHLGWVEFMLDVGRSYTCVFSTWTLEAPSRKLTFRSEDVGDPDVLQ